MSANSKPHQIRLAGPWQIQSEVETNERIKLPFVSSQYEQPTVIRRTFQGSAGILAADRIHVRIAFQGTKPAAQLNENSLIQKVQPSDAGSLEFDATGLLQKSNSLALTCSAQANSTVTDVCLLIFDQ